MDAGVLVFRSDISGLVWPTSISHVIIHFNFKWLRADYTAGGSSCMTVQLVPPGNAPPGGDWAYCTSENGVPEQINLQVMCV